MPDVTVKVDGSSRRGNYLPVESRAGGIRFEVSVEDPVRVRMRRAPVTGIDRPRLRGDFGLSVAKEELDVFVRQLVIHLSSRDHPAPGLAGIGESIADHELAQIRL